jgi:hypothetical protein
MIRFAVFAVVVVSWHALTGGRCPVRNLPIIPPLFLPVISSQF